MKIKKGFELRTICGEELIISQGIENIDFSKIISMNPTAAFLWRGVTGKVFTVKDMCKLLTDEYEVDEATALKDATELAQEWIKVGIVEE